MQFRSIGISLIFLGSIFLWAGSCSAPDPADSWEPLDLLPYGVPVSIRAPEGSKVNTMDLGISQDITIRNEEYNYHVQLFASNATTTRKSLVVEREKEQVISDVRFVRFIKQDEDGFIYELEYSGDQMNYNFRYVLIRGDREYLFQTGLIGLFSQEDVEQMYAAVQQ